MFVAVDFEGNVLKKPSCDCLTEYDREGCPDKCWQYINRSNIVLFEGFKIIEIRYGIKRLSSPCGTYNLFWYNIEKGWYPSNGVEKETIEYLVKYGLTLTPNALKQLQ